MESTVKIFFRGMTIKRIKKDFDDKSAGNQEFSLDNLEQKGIVETRIRKDTKVK